MSSKLSHPVLMHLLSLLSPRGITIAYTHKAQEGASVCIPAINSMYDRSIMKINFTLDGQQTLVCHKFAS